MSDVVLVTGGAGFIGSHACKALRRAGYRPVSFDNLSTGHADAVRFGPLVRGDVRDAAAVEAALRGHGAAAVIHFAASAYVGESVSDPAKYYDNNLGGMIGLIQGCRAAGVRRIVFSSSCATYGVPASLPIRETLEQRPINPYGRTKLICEQMLRDMWVEGFAHVALRYFNAAGADPEGELGERHDPETHLLPLALRAASGQGSPLAIFGTDYPTPDGTCIRDYIHVADLARAHVLALGRLLSGGESVALNLGTGRGLSVREIVQAIEATTGRRVPLRMEPRRPGDPPELTADPARAAAELGFRTECSDIATIVRHAAPWFGLETADVAAQ
ncbi:UDP-glucose 4-epimerase GalE [Cereibacter sphaeroides]|uniref:UDP-glucose 4-epimerase GalE n=1 Tax=Cereibacter sphaeroides TaxID=1063 RepID=UPI001F4724AE|nr:UDP-glucose 4-epimerase GalE [Cereibacter sphaeroides]MCE6961830.1 UDP-glucose 4-epimerase GalE [Cereibacter sphaeroides]MCE6970605.1 UDP-glucose 4-epimerase GalE [Cereibacter sphaeroides]MCE6975799.1 UDP-glucose 4-epimerase GalE [Cereibacter sphaeroides]